MLDLYKFRKITILLLCWFVSVASFALNHIGGGELYITRIVGNTYRVQLIYYYDALNYQEPPDTGIPTEPSPPTIAQVSIYSKATNVRMTTVALPRVSSSIISLPFNPCIDKSINYKNLERIVYEATVVLNSATYNSPQGYYAVFQDYSRNTTVIKNLEGNRIGITMYAEFPRTSITNSNPVFNNFSTLYICNGQTANLNFSATDADGDVLVYSLETPTNALPIRRNPPPPVLPPPLPAVYPYPVPLANWAMGYNVNNAIPSFVGQPLSINSSTGILTVNPAEKGLYAFAVKCEEFRGGIKIGEVRREIQIFVDACQSVIDTPIVRLQLPNGSYYNVGEILEIDADIFPENNIQLNVEAQIVPDIYRPMPVRFSLFGTNFSNNPARFSIAPIQSNANGSGIAAAKLRISECLEFNRVYELRIEATNQQCPTPGTGSLNVKIKLKNRSVNIPPRLSITSSIPANIANNSTVLVSPKDTVLINLIAVSPNTNARDSLELAGFVENYSFEQLGMKFTYGRKDVVNVRGSFEWQPSCDLVKSNGQVDTFKVAFIAKRTPPNRCFTASDTIRVKFVLRDTYAHFNEFLPPNAFSPNGDGRNDVFQLSNLQPAPPILPTGEPNPNLPLDNCFSRFEKIVIYNRWGKEVFSSADRNFVWQAEKEPSGVYYYVIEFSSRSYKGTINVMK